MYYTPGSAVSARTRCAACRMSGLPSESVGQVQKGSEDTGAMGQAADQSLGDPKLSTGEHDLLAGNIMLSC